MERLRWGVEQKWLGAGAGDAAVKAGALRWNVEKLAARPQGPIASVGQSPNEMKGNNGGDRRAFFRSCLWRRWRHNFKNKIPNHAGNCRNEAAGNSDSQSFEAGGEAAVYAMRVNSRWG